MLIIVSANKLQTYLIGKLLHHNQINNYDNLEIYICKYSRHLTYIYKSGKMKYDSICSNKEHMCNRGITND